MAISATFAQAPSEIIGPGWEPGRVRWVKNSSPVSRSFTKDTLSFGPSAPFFDDFSQGKLPDSTLWDLKATLTPRYPLIHRGAAINPPSLGILTFDGASPLNQPYTEDLARGPADRLESHFIDLGNLGPSNNLMLTFFLQPQGVGHQPTFRDSFKVYFNALTRPGGDTAELVKVFAQAGGPASGFRQVRIRLDDPLFFHTRFYMAFESEGYLNGLLHAWQMDYVLLGMNRSPGDTLYRDASVCYLSRPPMAPYTAIAYQQYQPNQFMQDFSVVGAYLGSNGSNMSFSGRITDPVGNNLPTPYQQTASFQASGIGPFGVPFSSYQDAVTLNSPYSASFLHEVALTGPADDHPENDRLIQEYRIDTLLAYDDGEADAGYGLNRSRGFGQRYEITSEDSMMAVWICFAPQIDYLKGGSLEGKDFRITIWHAPHPDSILYQQGLGAQVSYGDSAHHFERYALSEAVSVSGTIWVGVSQLDDVALGVGFDRSYNNDGYVYWDSSGHWVQSRLGGTLMIRPEMRNILYNPGPFLGLEDTRASLGDLVLFPNPYSGGQLYLKSGNLESARQVHLSVRDLQGHQVFVSQEKPHGGYALPEDLPGGIYLLRLEGVRNDGSAFAETRKFVIQR